MDHRLFQFIWRYSRFDQIIIVLLILLSLPFYFLLLELPKIIVNDAIQGQGFAASATTAFPEIAVPFSGNPPIVLFAGFDVTQIQLLFLASLCFLLLVIINGLFKFVINAAKGRLGERMLRRLRFMLFDRLQAFPLAHFREVKAAEVATMIKDETEPLGGFIGDAIVQPIFLGGLSLTAMFFIFAQNVWLGAVAGAVALCQVMVIPRLRAPILLLGRQRQLMARDLAGRIGQSVDTITEVRNHGTEAYERGVISGRLGNIFDVRFRIYQRKFLVKFINNLLAQFTPFLFYVLGGYLVIRGSLDVGQLLAVLVAYKELPGPMKELIDWDQRRLDAQIKYEQITIQFASSGEVVATKIPDPDAAPAISITALTVEARPGPVVLENISVDLPLDLVASVEGEGASEMLQCIAGMRERTGGQIMVQGHSARSGISIDAVAYAGVNVPLSGPTVFDDMVYPLLRKTPPEDMRTRWGREAVRSGNPAYPDHADWTDPGKAGVTTVSDLRTEMVARLDTVGMTDDLYAWGLRHPLGMAIDDALIIQARVVFAQRVEEKGLRRYIEPFAMDRYIEHATIGENLMFGASRSAEFQGVALAAQPVLRRALGEAEADLVSIGREIAAFMVEVFDGLSEENSPLLQFAFFDGSRIPEFDAMLAKSRFDGGDRTKLIELALEYDESRYRLGLVSASVRERIVVARGRFEALITSEAPGAVAFFKPDEAAPGMPMIDAILFGKVVDTIAGARRRIENELGAVLTEKGLLGVVLDAGLGFVTGHRAALLSPAQRQRLAVARCLLRRPRMLLLDNGLSATRIEEEQAIVKRIVESGIGLLMVTERETVAAIPASRVLLSSDNASVCPNGHGD